MWYWFVIVFLLLVISILIFFILNLNKQIDQLEEPIKKLDAREDELLKEVENYYRIFLGLFSEAYSNMQRVDKNGAYSSDDEVGFAFKVLYNSIQEVYIKLKEMTPNEEN